MEFKLKKPKVLIFLLTIVVFSAVVFYYFPQDKIEPAQAQGITYYASNTGSGTDCTNSNPCSISGFWNVNGVGPNPGDTLLLKDGIYKGSNYMIEPPADYSDKTCHSYFGGTSGNPITIKAQNDGEVEIDGQDVRKPVYLLCTNYMIIEGINAHSSKGSVFEISYGDNNIIRRCVGWDAVDGNTNVFASHYNKNNLFEDCAGWGVARKVFSPSQSDGNMIFRRVFAMLNENNWGGQIGMTGAYNSNNNIVENAIVTVDGEFSDDLASGTANNISLISGYIAEDRPYDLNNKVLGSISYRKKDQRVIGATVHSVFRTPSSNKEVKDVLVYVEEPESTYDALLRYTAMFNDKVAPNNNAQYLTLIGGPGSHFWSCQGSQCDCRYSTTKTTDTDWHSGEWCVGGSNDGNICTSDSQCPSGVCESAFQGCVQDYQSTASHIIATDARWTESTYVDFAVDSWYKSYSYPPEYVMTYNNLDNFDKQPTHWIEEDPNLIGRCGNILQYGCSESERPKVDGQSVGAQIQYRYIDGELTNEPLWPWPMNQRIIDALIDSGYDARGIDGAGGLDLTKIIFELDGGTLPNFDQTCWPPDFDCNMTINTQDLTQLKTLWGQTGESDLNQDNITNVLDLGIMMSGWSSN